jgi:hypothetical protein
MITSLSIGKGGLGRFGNQMFTIAGCIGIAVKSGQPYAFPHWKNYDNALFGNTVDDLNAELECPLPLLPDGLDIKEYGYFWGYKDIVLPTGSWSIDAHMQDPRFFSHCIDLVRHHFTFKNEPPGNDYVAIHYRAGDYQDNPDAYHPRCSVEYYIQAMELFPEGTHFELFSDDPDGAFDMLHTFTKGKSLANQGRSSSYIEGFKLMKNCKHHITANSSFSLMAAILANQPGKKIVCPKRWFGASAGDMVFDGYPENAIIL